MSLSQTRVKSAVVAKTSMRLSSTLSLMRIKDSFVSVIVRSPESMRSPANLGFDGTSLARCRYS